jgi:hypothetical protein
MDPAITAPDSTLAAAQDGQDFELGGIPEEKEEEEEDEDDDDDEDEDDEDEDEDEDDDVGTDEAGNEMLKAHSSHASGPDGESPPAPDVDSDRVPSTDAEPEGSLAQVKAAPLGIQEIEHL